MSDPVGESSDDPDDGPDPVVVTRGLITVTATDARAADVPPVHLGTLAAILAGVLAAEGVAWPAEASITLVDREAMAGLNLEHMAVDGPTDVLSFPIDGAEADDATPERPAVVGDLVLCPDVAAANAPTHAGTPDDEFALLVVHGGLHLLGWDHATPEEQAVMWAREAALLPALHRPPTRDPWMPENNDN